MSHTVNLSITSESWTPIFLGAGSIQIQLGEKDPVKVHIGQSAPASDAPGIVLYNGGIEEYVNHSVEDGDTVYVRALGDDSEITFIGTGDIIS